MSTRMFNRYHSSDDMDGLGELADVYAPVAVVVRPDGSLDVYGDIGIIDQRPDPGCNWDHRGQPAKCENCGHEPA